MLISKLVALFFVGIFHSEVPKNVWAAILFAMGCGVPYQWLQVKVSQVKDIETTYSWHCGWFCCALLS